MTLPAVLVVLLAGTVAEAAPARSTKARLAELEARVEALETRLTRQAAPAPVGDAAAALALYQEASRLAAQGDAAGADALLDRLLAGHTDPRAVDAARRLKAQLEVYGREVHALDGVTWLRGDGGLDPQRANLLVFWEVWCPHCQRELPKLQATADVWGPRGLKVTGLTKISRGKTVAEVTSYLDGQGITFPNGQEDGAMTDLFDVTGVPAAAVVKGGKVVWRGHPAQITDDMLRAWTE